MKEYTAWLIEGNDNFYLTMGDFGMFVWTTDALQALHFCRRSDAEKVAAECEDAWKIIQHGFADIPETPESERMHFIQCGVCGEWIDCRNLDEVLYHEDHKLHIATGIKGEKIK